MLKCNICGHEFEPGIDALVYTARDDCKTGFQIMIADEEKTLYDAFDCPKCGCQVIAQQRKRTYDIIDIEENCLKDLDLKDTLIGSELEEEAEEEGQEEEYEQDE